MGYRIDNIENSDDLSVLLLLIDDLRSMYYFKEPK